MRNFKLGDAVRINCSMDAFRLMGLENVPWIRDVSGVIAALTGYTSYRIAFIHADGVTVQHCWLTDDYLVPAATTTRRLLVDIGGF